MERKKEETPRKDKKERKSSLPSKFSGGLAVSKYLCVCFYQSIFFKSVIIVTHESKGGKIR